MGLTALAGDQCLSPVSVCDTNAGTGSGLDGGCRPVWWAWLVIGLVVLFLLEASCAAASAAAARQSSTASAAAAGGTRATPLPELAEPSFPPKRPSGQHLNIEKLFGTSPESTDLQEKFIQKITFSLQKNVILST